MIIKRIDLFMPPNDHHDILKHYTKKLRDALVRLGVECRILEAERLNPLPFLLQLFENPPDCTLSFNGLLPDDEGRFFSELVKIPHVAFLANSSHHFFSLVNSSYNIIATADHFAATIFKGMGHKNSLFVPHGIEPIVPLLQSESRPYDILFVNGIIDIEKMEKKWQKQYPKEIFTALLEAANTTIEVSSLSFMQALTDKLHEDFGFHHPKKQGEFNLSLMLDDLETYILMKNNLQIAKELKGCRIHAVGNESTKQQWNYYLGKNYCELSVSENSSFKHITEAMKESKVIINSAPSLKDGTNDYVFPATASEGVLVTNDNSYLEEHFEDEKEILFYNSHNLDTLRSKIEPLIADSNKRKKIGDTARNTTLHHHTWDHRAAFLLKELAPIIANIKQTKTQ